MKAIRFHRTGDPQVLRYEDVPDPEPASGEVLLYVKAAALNRLDVFLRSGASGMPGFKLPHIGGFDIAGQVAAVGPDADETLIGESMVVAARVTGPAARSKLDIIGISRPGGFAEMVAVPALCLRPKPAAYSFEEAAAFGCVYLTAHCGLAIKAALKPGEFVLVHAGGSGAGTAAVQVAKALGAIVITTAGSEEKCAKARDLLRADHTINYKKQDFREEVNRITAGRGVDVVFDPVWGESAAKTLDCLAFRARWVVLGMVGGLIASIDVAKFMFKEASLLGLVEFYADDAQIAGAWAMADRGVIRPIISRVWPLAETPAAHAQMERGDFFGKIVVAP
jgi:NADPH:quinone reductase-like Zn-dependent oxidoreductase